MSIGIIDTIAEDDVQNVSMLSQSVLDMTVYLCLTACSLHAVPVDTILQLLLLLLASSKVCSSWWNLLFIVSNADVQRDAINELLLLSFIEVCFYDIRWLCAVYEFNMIHHQLCARQWCSQAWAWLVLAVSRFEIRPNPDVLQWFICVKWARRKMGVNRKSRFGLAQN